MSRLVVLTEPVLAYTTLRLRPTVYPRGTSPAAMAAWPYGLYPEASWEAWRAGWNEPERPLRCAVRPSMRLPASGSRGLTRASHNDWMEAGVLVAGRVLVENAGWEVRASRVLLLALVDDGPVVRELADRFDAVAMPREDLQRVLEMVARPLPEWARREAAELAVS